MSTIFRRNALAFLCRNIRLRICACIFHENEKSTLGLLDETALSQQSGKISFSILIFLHGTSHLYRQLLFLILCSNQVEQSFGYGNPSATVRKTTKKHVFQNFLVIYNRLGKDFEEKLQNMKFYDRDREVSFMFAPTRTEI